jgi:DNA recombination protein RmuC
MPDIASLDPVPLAIAALLLVVLVAGGWVAAAAARRARAAEDAALDQAEILERLATDLARSQAQQAGRMEQVVAALAAQQAQVDARLQTQERMIAETVDARLTTLSARLEHRFDLEGTRAAQATADLRARLAVIDQAQRNIADLGQKVVGLQDILANKQARGAFGEVQLADLVGQMLPPGAYAMQATLSNGRRADCLIHLPHPPGPIVVDAKFPLESFHLLRQADNDARRTEAARAFRTAVMAHVKAISERYLIPGETADGAVMFLPSEAVYAELHGNFQDVVEKAFRARVWIVSPTTLMATLTTIRAVLKDVRVREQAAEIRAQVTALLDDLARLDDRAAKLVRHFEQAAEDLRGVRLSADRAARRAERIDALQLGDRGTEDEAG